MRIALLLLLLVACSGQETVRGVVVDVQGDLQTVERFTLLTEEGEQLEFVPGTGLRFDGGPLSHLRQHMVSGEPVRVRYESESGALVVVEVSDG